MLTAAVWHKKALNMTLDLRSMQLRALVFRAFLSSKRGHIGSALSLIEILRILYDEILCYHSDDPSWCDRDYCILSKGHGCLALYALLADKGFFPLTELDTFCKKTSLLGGHPEPKTPGVEWPTGSLGHGLSVGIGMAIAARMRKKNNRVFVIVGDGEINEGSIWEAALSAAKHKLDNLIVIVDYNQLQSYGSTESVLNLEPLVDKWVSFGFSVFETNGHDLNFLRDTFLAAGMMNNKPKAIICHTVKGKGIAIAEDNLMWHHKSKLSDSEMLAVRAALDMEQDLCVQKV